MKKISWKKSKGGRAFEHILEGWVGGEKCFQIEGRLCVTDLRPINGEPWQPPVHYYIEDPNNAKEEAKQIAYDVLNGLNKEKHEANLERQRIKDEHTRKVLEDAQAFLDSLKNK